MNNEINGYRNNINGYPNFQLIDSNTSSTLAGRPAYKLVYTSNQQITSSPMKSLETGTIVGSKVYSIQANIDAGQYSNYFPIIQKMIDSFRITQPIQQATSNMTNATAVGGGGGNMTSSSATTNATS